MIPILNFNAYKFLQLITIICLIQINKQLYKNQFGRVKQLKNETPRKLIKPSHTWHDNKDKVYEIHQSSMTKNISSQPNMLQKQTVEQRDELLEAFQKIINIIKDPFIITDEDAKPILCNQKLTDLFGTDDPKNIQFSLVSMDIKKIDKITQKLIQKKYEKINPTKLFYKQQSLATQQVLSTSSKQFKQQLLHIMKLLVQDHQQCQLLDFDSEFSQSQYMIQIQQINGYYLFWFTYAYERDNYKNKINTTILMNQLFRSMSHEFSTSLNSIQILAENALEEFKDNFTNKYIRPLLNSSYILNSIVQDVRDFSLILSKNFTLTIKLNNVATLITEVATLFSSQIKNKGLQIKIDTQDIWIHTDGQRVKQCLVNLISNAQKFTFSGCITLQAFQEQIRDINYIKLCVQDTGIGIDNETQTKLRYFLKNNFTQRFRNQNQSYGIGLMISEKITRGLSPNYEGGLQIESEINQGTKIWFYLQDLNQAEIFEDHSRSRQTIRYNKMNSAISSKNCDYNIPITPKSIDPKRSFSPHFPLQLQIESRNPFLSEINSEHPSENISYIEEDSMYIPSPPYIMEQCFKKPKNKLTNKKILIVDDEFVNIYAIQLMLNRLGYQCDSAGNGKEGYELFIKNEYQLILMDVEMPIMNGLVSTQKILGYCYQNQIDKPIIIAQTAYTDIGTKQNCLEAGMDYFINKPIKTSEIKDVLSNYGL